jgi:isopentenyldiphosphate isomerase
MTQRIAKADELFFIVDENDQPQPPLPRKLVHGHGVWHRVSHVWIVNDAGQILCQQRALNKELAPGCWEPFFGGHLSPDESYEDAAKREVQEELGIAVADLRQIKINKFTHPTGYNNEFQAVFATHWQGDAAALKFDESEVAQVAWRPQAEVAKAMQTNNPLWSHTGYELAAIANLQEQATQDRIAITPVDLQ